MSKIGIGVTTFNRPHCIEKWQSMVNNFTPDMSNVKIHIAEDSIQDRKGVAARKNECLRSLIECDYVFLFDDDCYPIKEGWVDFFANSGHEHLLFADPNNHVLEKRAGNLMIFSNSSGVFMFLTKSAIQRVGAFDEQFSPFGFEHIDYSNRILCNSEYPMLEGTESYLYAEDFYNPYHRTSISEYEKIASINKNTSYFKALNKNKTRYIPL